MTCDLATHERKAQRALKRSASAGDAEAFATSRVSKSSSGGQLAISLASPGSPCCRSGSSQLEKNKLHKSLARRHYRRVLPRSVRTLLEPYVTRTPVHHSQAHPCASAASVTRRRVNAQADDPSRFPNLNACAYCYSGPLRDCTRPTDAEGTHFRLNSIVS